MSDATLRFPIKIDGVGARLFSVTMLGLICGLIEGSTSRWAALPLVLAYFAAVKGFAYVMSLFFELQLGMIALFAPC